jgi:DNA-binding NarL/FixJ family response regulator
MMQRPSLLIADDDPVIRVFLERGLSAGFDVVGTAANSVEAVELARSTRPDAALVDVEMPLGGGLRAVEGITEVTPETAIVVLSGDESESSVRELMLAGAVAYRRKGVDLRVLTDSLVAAIAAHGNSRRSAA